MEEVVRVAKNVVLRDGYHVPILLASGAEGTVGMILDDFPGEHELKVKCMFFAGNQIAKQRNVGNLNKVFFVSEAWMGRATKDGIYIRPSLDPNRVETLVISCLEVLNKIQTVQMFEYVRDVKGKLIELKQMELPDQADRIESPLLPAFVAGYLFKGQ